LVNDQRDAQIPFYVFIFLFITLYMFRAHRAHYQERQIVSIQPLITVPLCWWPCRLQVGSELLYQYNLWWLSLCVSGLVTPNLHTTRPPTQSDSYQRLYC